MGKYKNHEASNKIQILLDIANELAEANRLKRIELEHILRVSEYDGELEDKV